MSAEPQLFRSLTLIIDGARNGALNMAIDEVLLRTSTGPVLRVYDWDRPTVSIGYSHRIDALLNELPPWPLVRRWTGGGVVRHQADSTYSLIVPAREPWSQTRPVESYRAIHSRLANCMNDAGFGSCRLAGDEDRKDGLMCFEAPAVFDIVRGITKLAGAGQRRSRSGMLHQGSVAVQLERSLWLAFAASLSEHVDVQEGMEASVVTEAEELAATRYHTDAWLHK